MGRQRSALVLSIGACACYLLLRSNQSRTSHGGPAVVAGRAPPKRSETEDTAAAQAAGGQQPKRRDTAALKTDGLPFKPRERSAAEAAWGDVPHPESVHSVEIRSKSFDKLGPDVGPKRMHGRLGESACLPSSLSHPCPPPSSDRVR
jgi:hypothetical protein